MELSSLSLSPNNAREEIGLPLKVETARQWWEPTICNGYCSDSEVGKVHHLREFPYSRLVSTPSIPQVKCDT